MLVFSYKTIIFIISFFNNLNFLHTLRSEKYVSSLIFYSWPAEGRPRPKVPNLGAVYILPHFLRIATQNGTLYREGYMLPTISQIAT